MNWYKKIITADTADFLRSIGGDNPEIEQIIEALQPGKLLHEKFIRFYVYEFRKNPNLTFQELMNIPLPNQLARNPLYNPNGFEQEVLKHFPGRMGPWALKVAIKYWREANNKANTRDPHMMNDYHGFLHGVIGTGGVWNHTIGVKLAEISDWYTRSGERIDLPSMTLEEAIQRSDEWHRAMAGEGEGKFYQEKNIVYGPKWTIKGDLNSPIEVKEYEGWTIQEVRGKNDLQVEGNKQNHCVSSYCRQVDEGNLKIFSLRDPYNEPHVTMEVSPDGRTFYQIKGHSNSEPKKEYQDMIKHWVGVLKEHGPAYTIEREYAFNDQYAEIDALNRTLHQMSHREEDRYGLIPMPDEYDFNVDDVIDTLITRSGRDHHRDSSEYSRDITESPQLLVDACVASGVEKFIPELEKVLSEMEEKARDEFYNWWSYDCYEDYPNIEKFESDELYEEEIENWQERCQEEEDEAIDEYQSNHLPFGFINDAFKYIRILKKKGVIPPYKAMVNAKGNGWYKKATLLTEDYLSNLQPSFEIVINDGTQYNLTAVQKVKSLGADPGSIIHMLVGSKYESGSIITEDGFIYTIGIDNQGRKIIAKVAKI